MHSRSRLAWIAAMLAAACGGAASRPAGPLDSVYRPTGLAVHHVADGSARLLAASSNGDLLYDDATGGAVLSIDPEGAAATSGVNIRSFAGDLAVADADACGTSIPGPLAVTATRGSSTLNVLQIDPSGTLSCYRCGVPLGGGPFSDPLAVTVACGGGRARVFVGYLRSQNNQAWISEYDLQTGELRSASLGSGPVRAFAYDAAHDRLYVVGLATGSPTPLRWVELAGGCRIDLPHDSGGCTVGEATFPSLAPGLELRSMALAQGTGPPQRAFLTGRYYDTAAAATAGGRTTDFGGVLLAVDLVENALGGLDADLVWKDERVGHGAQDVRVLPSRGPGRGEVLAVLAVDEGVLSIYDDESRDLKAFLRAGDTGAPLLGHEPFGLAVDPVAVASVAHAYVGSFADSFITPVDVPLDAPDAAFIPTTAAGSPRRITGGRP